MNFCRGATLPDSTVTNAPGYAAFAMKEGSPDMTEWCNASCRRFRLPSESQTCGLRPETLAENPCASVKPNRYG